MGGVIYWLFLSDAVLFNELLFHWPEWHFRQIVCFCDKYLKEKLQGRNIYFGSQFRMLIAWLAGSIAFRIVVRQKHNDIKAWWKKCVHFIAVPKQRKWTTAIADFCFSLLFFHLGSHLIRYPYSGQAFLPLIILSGNVLRLPIRRIILWSPLWSRLFNPMAIILKIGNYKYCWVRRRNWPSNIYIYVYMFMCICIICGNLKWYILYGKQLGVS